MVASFTSNYNLIKSEVGGSRDQWGTNDNANWDALDGLIKALNDGKLGGAVVGGFRQITEAVAFSSAPKIGDQTVTGNTIATQAWVTAAIKAAIDAVLPNTLIAIHKGTIASIPAGWVLCDGQNGTLDLRGRFILGAGLAADGYAAPVTTGGASTHDHGGATGGHALTSAENGPHVHGVTDPGHNHGVNDPGHYHVTWGFNSITAGAGTNNPVPVPVSPQAGTITSTGYTGISIVGNGTGISIASSGAGTAHTHPVTAASNIPPYYALCFIQRVVSP